MHCVQFSMHLSPHLNSQISAPDVIAGKPKAKQNQEQQPFSRCAILSHGVIQ